jgi:alginate O-acetyltransferase complex protein AlgI
MISTIFINYISAILIDKYKDTKIKKIFLIVSITINLALLCVFKYSDFILENINNLFNKKISLLRLALPIGISFYTFQVLSYTIDVYNQKVKVQKNFLKLATYVSLFPQLIAGPIVRYETIEKELNNRTHSFENFSYGIRRLVFGLSKKILIANNLGELCNFFMEADEKSIAFYWVYGIAYSLQIYFDFSAYSDMAIGLGRIFGFHFLENFNYPYISKSITEFWRRWHISLSSWFRDYVYIPLGGSKNGKLILIRNIFIVWFLTGLWHGASWNFIIWGLLFGVLLVIEKIFLSKFLEKLPNVIKRLYVLFVVMISFIIFDSTSMQQAIHNILGLFGINGDVLINKETIYYLSNYLGILVIAIIGSTPILKNIIEKLKEKSKMRKVINLLEPIVIIILLLLSTAYILDNSYNPFLYFRF